MFASDHAMGMCFVYNSLHISHVLCNAAAVGKWPMSTKALGKTSRKTSRTQLTSTTLVCLERSHCTSQGLGPAFSAQLGYPVQAAEGAQLGWIQEPVFLAQASQFLGKVFIKF